MQELKTYDDVLLINKTRELVEREREITTKILHYLKEINGRMLYAKFGYASLYEFAITELRYSESQAYRRISAMRLLADLPEIETKISSGELSLSNACKLHQFFKSESKIKKQQYTKNEKLILVEKVENKSTRECEVELSKLSPKAFLKENTRIINEEFSSITLTADKELLLKIEKVRDLYSHQLKTNSLAEVIELIADIAINEKQKKWQSRKIIKKNKNEEFEKLNSVKSTTTAEKLAIETENNDKNKTQISASRYIPKKYRELIYARANGQCEFISSLNHKRCSCRKFLEIDHMNPLILGGKTLLNNLRLVCKTHNLMYAKEKLGAKIIDKYLAA